LLSRIVEAEDEVGREAVQERGRGRQTRREVSFDGSREIAIRDQDDLLEEVSVQL